MMNLDGARSGGGETPDGWKPKKTRPPYEAAAANHAEDNNPFPGDWRVKQSKQNRMNGNDDPSKLHEQPPAAAPQSSPDMEYADDSEEKKDDAKPEGEAKARKGEKFKFYKDSPYEVSNMGRIRRGSKILKPRISSRGFAYLHASYNGQIKQPSFHSLVMELFGPKPPKGVKNPVISHKNDKKTDNRIENLKWQSNAKNTEDAYDHGLYEDKGANNPEWRKKNGKKGEKKAPHPED